MTGTWTNFGDATSLCSAHLSWRTHESTGAGCWEHHERYVTEAAIRAVCIMEDVSQPEMQAVVIREQ